MRMRNAVAMLWLAAGPAMAADDWVLLEKAAQAAKQQALVGAYFHQIGSTSESFRLYRAVLGGVLRERRESLDGAPRDIVRDQDGWLSHPAMPVCDESVRYDDLLAVFGIETAFVSLESQDERLAERYFEESASIEEWQPEPPAG